MLLKTFCLKNNFATKSILSCSTYANLERLTQTLSINDDISDENELNDDISDENEFIDDQCIIYENEYIYNDENLTYQNESDSNSLQTILPNKICSGIANEPDMIKVHQEQLDFIERHYKQIDNDNDIDIHIDIDNDNDNDIKEQIHEDIDNDNDVDNDIDSHPFWIDSVKYIDSFTKKFNTNEAHCKCRFTPPSIIQYYNRCKFLISAKKYATDTFGNDIRIYIPKTQIKYDCRLLQYTTIDWIVFGGHYIYVGDYVHVQGIIIYDKELNQDIYIFRLFSIRHPSINITVQIHQENQEAVSFIREYSIDYTMIFVEITGIVCHINKPTVNLCTINYLPQYSAAKLLQNNLYIENEVMLVNPSINDCKPQWLQTSYEKKIEIINQFEDKRKEWINLYCKKM